jgi:hypothetical protein
MDIRGIKVAGKDLSSTGLTSLGKPKEGGFTKRRADQVEKRQKRAKELEVGEDENLKQNVRHREAELHEVKTGNLVDEHTGEIRRDAQGNPIRRQDELIRLNNGELNHDRAVEIEEAMNNDPGNQELVRAFVESRGLGGLERDVTDRDRLVATAERALKDATDTLLTAPPERRVEAEQEVHRLRVNRDAEINGGHITNENGEIIRTVIIGRDQAKDNLRTRQAAVRGLEGPIHEAENMLKLAENELISENNQRKHSLAHTIQQPWSQTISFITSGGQHSFAGEREAANKILADVQEEKKITPTGHH